MPRGTQRQKEKMSTSAENEYAEAPPVWLLNYLEEQRKAQEKTHLEQINALKDAFLSASHTNRVDETIQNVEGNHIRNMQASEKLPKPAKPSSLDVEFSHCKFVSWRESWSDYSKLLKIDKLPNDMQRAYFRNCITEEMRAHIKCAVGINEEEDISVNEILNRIQGYLRGKRNIALDRVAFANRKQEEGESFDHFYVALKKLAEESEKCRHCYDESMVTKIMSSISDSELRKKLLILSPFPKLHEVVNTCRSHESAMKDAVNIMSGQLIEKVKTPYKRDKILGRERMKKCEYCNKEWHKRDNCPANRYPCGNCGEIGHWKIVCEAPRKKKINEASNENEEEHEKKLLSVKVSAIDEDCDTRSPKVCLTIEPVK